jgi:hypothetical protein
VKRHRLLKYSKLILKLFRGVPVAPGMKQNPTSPIQCKTTTPRFLIAIALVLGFALSPAPTAFSVNPPPDGGYPGNNTAEGTDALFSLTSGIDNTALGFQALYRNTTGNYNTAEGFRSLFNNNTGANNTASGVQALFSNTTGNYNTALGVNTLYRNTTGPYNTATGWQALFNNTNGSFNTATGAQALFSNIAGNYNTALGLSTLYRNTTGGYNAATGWQALLNNTTGITNTANGPQALYHNTTGTNNIAFGYQAGFNLTTGDNNIDIGAYGVAAESNTIRIGAAQQATYIAGISGKTAAGGAAVFVAANGKLGTVTSSRRFKKDIADMDAASEALLALRPVSFRYKPELDKAGIPQYGLVAEEVAEVNPDLVLRDENGEIYTVRYEAVNAMLLNEFLKEHRKVQELKSTAVKQEATIAELKKDFRANVAQLTARLDEQQSQIQKVNAQLELSRSTPQTIVENR